jgi:membrane protease YdiL (CAAX protease family)
MAASDGDTSAPRWGLGDVAIALVPIGLFTLLALAGDDADTPDPTLGDLVASQAVLWLFLLGVPLYAARAKGNGVVRDFGLVARPADLPGGFALGVFLQAVVVWALYVPVFWLSDLDVDEVSEDARELIDITGGGGLVVLVLLVGVGAPIVEEIFYRGLLLRSLQRRFGDGWALVGSTGVFALSHAQAIQFPALVVFGAVAGALALRTGRLGPSIALHVGFNAWTLFNLIVLDG